MKSYRFLMPIFCLLSSLSTAQIYNFGEVTPHIFRGGRLDQSQYEVIAQKGVQTIINLEVTPDDPHLCDLHGLECLQFPLVLVPLFSEQFDFETFFDAFNTTLSHVADGKSVYIHCFHGSDRTGLLAAMLENHFSLNNNQPYDPDKQWARIESKLLTHYFHSFVYPNLIELIKNWTLDPPPWVQSRETPIRPKSMFENILKTLTPVVTWVAALRHLRNIDDVEEISPIWD